MACHRRQAQQSIGANATQTSQEHYMMPLDKVREEEDLSESSTVELKMPPSPTSMSASSPDDTENEAVPSLEPADSWEDSNDDDDNDDGGDQNKGDRSQTSSSTLSRKFDDFLVFWNEWSSSSLRTDQGLKLLQWSFWAASRLTAPGKPTPGYRGNLNRRYLNPELSPALRKCYADMSLVRYCLRLYGLPSSIEAVRSGSWSAGWEDPRIHKLGKIMAWSMALYYPFEHVAFTGWVVPKFSRQFVDENRWSAISCRFWSIYIVSDFASSVLKLKELAKRREKVAREIQSGSITENEAETKRSDIAKQTKLQKLHLARCSFFLLPAINWSLPKWATDPLLPESIVNSLMLAEAGTCIYQSFYAMRD